MLFGALLKPDHKRVLNAAEGLGETLTLLNSETLTTAVVYTILLSILLHGMTANPWARAFGDRAAGSA